MSDIITPGQNGSFEITTSAGTVLLYEAEAVAPNLTRKPGMTRPTGGEEPARLPGDFERVELSLWLRPAVGEPLIYWIDVDGETQGFTTAPITSIREL